MLRKFLLTCFLCIVAANSAADTLLVLGNSLSAGYGLKAGEGWVTLLQQRLQQRGVGHQVVNASISGDTSAGGLARLDAVLDQHRPHWLLLELGANDGLRGLSLAAMRANLEKILMRARARGIKVVLIGIEIPPNYGRVYTEGFRRVYHDLAAKYSLPFVPFLMEQVALDPAMLQADQLHPNAQAQPLLLETVWPIVEPLLRPEGVNVRAAPGRAAPAAAR